MKCLRSGFTLIELLVVITIIAILIALLLPAVQAARESARRLECRNNLKQLALAVHNYHGTHRRFPAGFVSNYPATQAKGAGLAWISMLLPFVEQGPLYQQLDMDAPIFDRDKLPPGMRCPSDPITSILSPTWFCGRCSKDPNKYVGYVKGWYSADKKTCNDCGGHWVPCWEPFVNPVKLTLAENINVNYVGCGGGVIGDPILPGNLVPATGVFGANFGARMRDVTDGTSNTFVLGERSQKVGRSAWNATVLEPIGNGQIRSTDYLVLGWTRGGLPNSGNALGFSSSHAGGCQMALCDGSVRFFSENIDRDTWSYLGQMNDGEVIGEF